ncbi:hypothetical protein Glove_9g265 [Diversispora epigaea]|uniref:SHSP domain-containing protein n=1 Tax=Diversispora epigaea TaxID=1348612 RepID=A0A397JQE6_9GLOM|nr:hypothetical protein Glove_9g265 [Diversispora epigaea]
MESFKDLIRTMEFEPYKPKCVEPVKYIDQDDYDKDQYDPLKDLGEKDELEFIIDEAASNHSNGIVKSENDLEFDIKIDFSEDFDIDFQVCNNILAIFGHKKLSSSKPVTKNVKKVEDSLVPAQKIIFTSKTRGSKYQSFCRTLLFPNNADLQNIYTEIIDGILHIKIPKIENLSDLLLQNDICTLCKLQKCLVDHFPGFSKS